VFSFFLRGTRIIFLNSIGHVLLSIWIQNYQFGFKKGCGTTEAIGVMRMLSERSIQHGNYVYICFVDFKKAFERIN